MTKVLRPLTYVACTLLALMLAVPAGTALYRVFTPKSATQFVAEAFRPTYAQLDELRALYRLAPVSSELQKYMDQVNPLHLATYTILAFALIAALLYQRRWFPYMAALAVPFLMMTVTYTPPREYIREAHNLSWLMQNHLGPALIVIGLIVVAWYTTVYDWMIKRFGWPLTAVMAAAAMILVGVANLFIPMPFRAETAANVWLGSNLGVWLIIALIVVRVHPKPTPPAPTAKPQPEPNQPSAFDEAYRRARERRRR